MNSTMTIKSGGERLNPRRRKLWECKEGYSCSIIGTCLRRNDIRKLSKKKLFGLIGCVDDFQIHTNLVGMSSIRCPQSKMLNKLLDTKYRAAIKRYGRAKIDIEIEKLWNQDVERGHFAGAYWAVMSHATISDALRSKIYGEIHMLSHDFFVVDSKEKQKVKMEAESCSMYQKAKG